MADRSVAKEGGAPTRRPHRHGRRSRLRRGLLDGGGFGPSRHCLMRRDEDVDAIAPPEIDITAGQDSGPVVFDA